ncbi:Retrovirus-related Pol polyprotein from transposon TNT 1-94 [Abeliophyllum distichum]|uniref:Retrovirus-related Pol polyprotein from transposon TNT 1-94 n=1 Tax=Abeliophyllum distichum TaxID=126358 RepID=A0ABD1PNG0_9LAMI
MESRNVSFFEHVFMYKSKEEASSSKRTYETTDQEEQPEEEDDEVEPRRSKRARTEKSFGPDFLTYMLESEPQSFTEVVNSSEVTRITSIRMILAITALQNLEVHQMDVKTVFLNRDLDEEIYIEQPESFSAPGQENKVCKLVKSLYGLKQAPKQ